MRIITFLTISWPLLLTIGLVGLMSRATADSIADADVLKVNAHLQTTDIWQFSVTVSHPDTGWEDYTDGWDVVLPGGEVVKPNPSEQFTRTLWHPHVGQQRFSRSQSGIVIPATIHSVTVRAHDKLHGFGGKEIEVDLDALR